MLLLLACLACGVCVYALTARAFDTSKKDAVRLRLSALITEQDLDSLYRSTLLEKKAKKRRERRQIIKVSKQLEDLLATSGVRLNASEYVYVWSAFTFVPALVLSLLQLNYLTVVAGSLIGFIIPPLLVRHSRDKRRQLFNRQLGDSLVIMSNCLSSGFSFQQAMESIATQMQPPISVEFTRALREMKFGVSLEDALDHMSERVKSDELQLLISAVLTSAQVGANLVDILGVCTEAVTDRIRIKDEIRVMSAQGKISGIILAALPVLITLVLMLMNPGYILSFFETPIGKVMIVTGGVMEFIGYLVIRKIVDVHY